MSNLSLVMIVKNESGKLKRCLDSVKDLVNEMIIVDTGSEDDTKEIAQSYGAKIFDYIWIQDFSKARNFALQHSTGDWNLVLDGDEYLNENECEKIKEFIKGPNRIGRIKQINTFMQDGEIKESQAIISRLFPKGLYYVGAIHEQVHSIELPRINTNIHIYHDGYFQTNKSDRNIKLLEHVISSNPNDAYMLFQLANEYRILGEYEKANIFFQKSYALITPYDGFKSLLVVGYLYNIIASKSNWKQGLDIISKEINNLSDYPDFYFVCGYFYMELVFSNVNEYIHYFSNIEQFYLKCLEIGETDKYDSVKGTGSFRAAYNLGVFYETNNNLIKAKHYYELSAAQKYEPAINRLNNCNFEINNNI
ncbi:glycosyltransferase [Paenibacillus sp. KACC 21273]|uniref:tetratricopeptide repeat-containing glycosyltransferase family 2 protein n=1 Tax=Paenibacillus sp. KACC 21273 TaxID=3025665 RepID=UPI0023665DF8|nr:glycosyltransferase [Paenibacillus sp. KACC 21273]WDF51476.1 glycosyltransferase [Paenibacillus sp. KACC 21273]